jgi:hypothetical protein
MRPLYGGNQAQREKEFAIAMVGPNGKAVWDYWELVGAQYDYAIPDVDRETLHIPDIHTCASIQIETKPIP